MVCLRNISVDTLHKGDTKDNNNNNNNNNNVRFYCYDNIDVLDFDVSEIFISNIYEGKKSYLRSAGVKWKLQPYTLLG
jgi:hypothetical protein